MDALRQALATIRQYLGKLGPTERLLIGSFAVILVMALFLVSQYAGRSSMVPLLPGAPVEDQQRAQAFLASTAIGAEMQNGQLVVPTEKKDQALALLTANKQLPSDTASFFKTLVSSQSWSNTRQQNEQLYNAALKAELDRIISSMPGIKSANVLFDVPEAQGLGAAVRKPTASVAVFTETGGPLDQKSVDAIAYLVGGAKAGLTPERVRVIDPRGQRRATSNDDVAATTYLEHAAKVEAETREKLADLLGYIPGVIIAVTAQVDVTRVVSKEQRMLATGEGSVALPKRSSTKESLQSDPGRGAEPGTRSNQQVDINRGPASRGPTSTLTEEEKDFENHVGTRVAETIDPRGMPTMIAVSVNIPRGYVAGLIKGPDATQAPDEAAIRKAFDDMIKPAVRESVLPHVRTMTQQSGIALDPKAVENQVVVSLIPLDLPPGLGGSAQQAGLLGGLASGTSVMGLSIGQLFDKIMVGFLALAAVGFMFTMVKKAGKKQELPSPQELVGVPPTLEAKSDLIGEADETDTPLAGIELAEGEIHSAKLLEQVADMVKENPESAAKLIRRWVNVED